MNLKHAFFLMIVAAATSEPCIERNFGHSSHVCVCNSTYCDQFNPELKSFNILHVESDRNGKRFAEGDVSWGAANQTVDLTVSLNRTARFQKILGFGGAFTDAAGINIAKLSRKTQENLIRSYFGPSGIEYNIGRINMGGCDFSDRTYTYCDTPGDSVLDTFSLTEEDLVYKIPYIKMAREMSRKNIQLFASPWSAPAWMKTNKALNESGFLLPEYYESWAHYFVKFLDSYRSEGVELWGLTAQNEPLDGYIEDFSFNCMGWNASMQTDWIAEFLGPALEEAGYGHVKLMAFDDQRPQILNWARTVMANPKAAKYVSGWAVHWYMDFLGFPSFLDRTAEEFPEKFIFYSEACTGSNPWDLEKVLLGSWERGQEYINNIMENLNHWSVGWTDWNLALDMRGGPNWAENFVDAPIIVNAESDEFYKNPMFYAMGHFSKFIPENSVRIGVTVTGPEASKIQMVSVETPEGKTVLVVTNRHLKETVNLNIKDGDKMSEPIRIGPESIHTFVW